MWNHKETNKILIFSVLIGCCSLLCYGAQDLNPDTATNLDKIQQPIANSKLNDLLETPTTKIAEIELQANEPEKKHNKTTTTTSTTEIPIEPTTSSTTTTPTTVKPTTAPTTEKPTTPTSTTVKPTTAPTTEKPTTPTSTTVKPTTAPTTEKPTTPTTTTTTTTSTTVKPTTTTTTTPKPNPPPKPDIGLWNCSCILFQMAAELNFSYPTNDSKTAWIHKTVPSDAKIQDHTCDGKGQTQEMVLEWGNEDLPNSLTIRFEKDDDSEYALYMLQFKIQSIDLPNSKYNSSVQLIYENHSINTTFTTPLEMSYHCTREEKLNLTSTLIDKNIIGYVILTNLQYQAFHNGSEIINKFATAKDCDAINTPDIVPIAVGISLIALILIVLISYLVARRRSMARGYMSF